MEGETPSSRTNGMPVVHACLAARGDARPPADETLMYPLIYKLEGGCPQPPHEWHARLAARQSLALQLMRPNQA